MTDTNKLNNLYNRSLRIIEKNKIEIDRLNKEIKEYKKEFKEMSDFCDPYIKFFDYTKTRVDKMIRASAFSYEWVLFKKGILAWEARMNGEKPKDIIGTEEDLMNFYEN